LSPLPGFELVALIDSSLAKVFRWCLPISSGGLEKIKREVQALSKVSFLISSTVRLSSRSEGPNTLETPDRSKSAPIFHSLSRSRSSPIDNKSVQCPTRDRPHSSMSSRWMPSLFTPHFFQKDPSKGEYYMEALYGAALEGQQSSFPDGGPFNRLSPPSWFFHTFTYRLFFLRPLRGLEVAFVNAAPKGSNSREQPMIAVEPLPCPLSWDNQSKRKHFSSPRAGPFFRPSNHNPHLWPLLPELRGCSS